MALASRFPSLSNQRLDRATQRLVALLPPNPRGVLVGPGGRVYCETCGRHVCRKDAPYHASCHFQEFTPPVPDQDAARVGLAEFVRRVGPAEFVRRVGAADFVRRVEPAEFVRLAALVRRARPPAAPRAAPPPMGLGKLNGAP